MIFAVTIFLVISILLSYYFYRSRFYLNKPTQDKNEFLIAIGLGFLFSLFPIIIVQSLFEFEFIMFQTKYKLNLWEDTITQFVNIFLHIGILEEGTKFLIVFLGCLLLYKSKFFPKLGSSSVKDRLSTIFLTFAGVSLGFAFIENIMYAFNYQDIILIIIRALVSTVIHVLCGTEMGYGFVLFLLEKNKLLKVKWFIHAIIVPITIHSLYDTVVKKGDSIGIYLIILGTFLSYEWISYRIEKLRNTLSGKD